MSEVKSNEKHDSNNLLDIDGYFEHVGSMGKQQVIVLLTFASLIMLPACQTFLLIFIARAPSWRCSGNHSDQCNTTKLYSNTDPSYRSRCEMNRSAWKYDSPKTYSLIIEFDMACSSEWLVQLANSAFFIGILPGSIMNGWLSDRYGRKKVLFPNYVLLAITSVSEGFVQHSWALILCRVLLGAFTGGVYITIVTMAVEIVGPKHRALSCNIFWCMWPFALCLLSLESWLITEWRILTLVISAPCIIFTLGARFTPVSVRWLRTQNRLDEAQIIFKNIAKMNKKIYPSRSKLKPIITCHTKPQGSFKDLFYPFHMCLMTIAFGTQNFCNNILYYGVVLAAGDFGGSLHRDFLLMTIIELPAQLLSIYIIQKFGSKKTILVCLPVTGIALTIVAFLKTFNVDLFALRIILGMAAKVFNILSWCASALWAAESYPTNIRSKARGVLGVIATCGSASSPWIVQWIKKFYVSLPFFILGGSVIVPVLLALTLKETKDVQIKDVLETDKSPPVQSFLLDKVIAETQ